MKRGISGDQIINFHNERQQRLLLGDYLARGETMLLYAPKGQGKTFNALMLSIALTTGGTFYNWKAHKPSQVLFVEGGEMTAYGIAERAQKIYASQGITSDRNFHLKAPTQGDPFTFNITDFSHQKIIESYVDEYKIDCVIFDNYNSLRLEEDSEFVSWQRLEKMLTRFKAKGVASVVIHHTNKEGQKQSGVQRKVDYCDIVIRIQKSRLSTRGNEFGPGKTYIEVDMEEFRWGESAPKLLTELVYRDGVAELVPADYERILSETIRADLDKFGIGYVRKKFDFLGYSLSHYLRFSSVREEQQACEEEFF